MDLRERLDRLNLVDKKSRAKPPRSYDIPYQKVTDLLQGEVLKGSEGITLVKRSNHPLPHYNGYSRLSLEEFTPAGLTRLIHNKDIKNDLSPQNMVFLDTETTGLAGGTGTYIFLLGLGYFQEDSFIIDQYFLLDYGEELEFLAVINKFLKNYLYVVTYNGKTFDLPLLNTRLKFNRIATEFEFEEHLDLLHIARKFWKRRLESCSLGRVEQAILGTSRKEDISGEFIPQIYFDYVTRGDMDYLPIVFEHNRMDILSLACLAGYMSQYVESPLNGHLSHGVDFYSLGRFYSIQGDSETAIACFQRALEYPLSNPVRFDTMKELALIYKRQGNWEQSVQIWTQMSAENSLNPQYVMEEMAKYYEHRLRDYRTARELVENYVSDTEQKMILNRVLGRENAMLDESLMKRLNRLKQKECKQK